MDMTFVSIEKPSIRTILKAIGEPVQNHFIPLAPIDVNTVNTIYNMVLNNGHAIWMKSWMSDVEYYLGYSYHGEDILYVFNQEGNQYNLICCITRDSVKHPYVYPVRRSRGLDDIIKKKCLSDESIMGILRQIAFFGIERILIDFDNDEDEDESEEETVTEEKTEEIMPEKKDEDPFEMK